MADETAINEPFEKQRNGNPGLKTLDSLHYDFARIK
jgi:hypothetical protein